MMQTILFLNCMTCTREKRIHALLCGYNAEYARYLHRKMNTKLTDFDVDEDLCDHLKEGWLKHVPFDIQVTACYGVAACDKTLKQ